MLNRSLDTVMLLALTLSFSACELIGDIFQVGFWIGVIIVVLIIAVISWIFRRGRR